MVRSLAARANYLALDRPDIAFATKELCRAFASPNQQSFLALKRLGRYLTGARRMVWQFRFQPSTDILVTSVDTDFAGCLSTRRSTSGGVSQRGTHLLKHWSSTQTTVTLSSAEAELNGICRGASTGLGLQTMAKDLGFSWALQIQTDATAAVRICRRRGLGRIRHLATADLWVQDLLRSGGFTLNKLPGTENTSDTLTKHIVKLTLCKHLVSLGLMFEDGRASLAPKIDA